MRPPRAGVLAAFAAIYLFWGATFLAIRYAVEDIPPLLMIGLRCAGGTLVLAGWLAWRGELARVTAAQWRTAIVAGGLLFLGNHALLAWAEQRVSSGEAALFMTGIPLWLVVLSAAHDRRSPPPRVFAALGLGVAGVAVLSSGAGWSGGTGEHVALITGGIAWAAGSLVARHGARPASAVLSTTLQLATGTVWVLAASGISGELAGIGPSAFSARAVASLAYLILFGTVLGFGAYTWLLQVTTPERVGSYAFVNPVVALLLAWVVGDGIITGRTVVAAVMVIGSVVLLNFPAWIPRRWSRDSSPLGSAPSPAGSPMPSPSGCSSTPTTRVD